PSSEASEPYKWSEGSALFPFAPRSCPAEPFGVCCHLPSVLLNNLFSGCASHQACTGLRRRNHFFTDHAAGFTLGRFAAAHQLRYAQSDHTIAFKPQHHPVPHAAIFLARQQLSGSYQRSRCAKCPIKATWLVTRAAIARAIILPWQRVPLT